MLTVNVRSNYKKLSRSLDQVGRKQLPLAFAKTLNQTMKAVWNYTVATAGKYEVILTQGCGRGGGGSRAVLETGGASLEFTVKDTGGYQNWIDVSLGEVTLEKATPQKLTVKVLKKARGIMDIRRIVLKPMK